MLPNLITHIRRYVSLSDVEADHLLSFLTPLNLKRKSHLLREGEVCRANYFVEKGCLRMFFTNEKGVEQITQFAIENWWIADYMSLATKTPATFNIQAIEHSKILAIESSSEDQLFKELPQLERYFRLVLQRAYAASQFRIKYQYDLSREEQYLHFSKSFPDFIQRVPQYMIASYLGFTPEYLSEIRKKNS